MSEGTGAEIAQMVVSDVTRLRAGIIGAGLMGHWHAHAVKKAGAQLAAVVDTDSILARRLAAKHQGAEIFSEVEAMLDRARVNVMHICTPVATHGRVAKLGIEAGVNLIIEKPVTPTAAETEHLFAQAQESGVLLCPTHQFVFQDGVIAAKKLLPRIGRIVDVSATLFSAGGANFATAQLDQLVADILPHPLSLMQLFLPGSYAQANWTTLRPCAGEMRAMCVTEGIVLSIFISLHARPTINAFVVRGTKGTIHLNLFHGYSVLETGEATRLRKIMHPFALSLRDLSKATINLGRRGLRGEPAYPGLQRLVKSFYGAVLSRGASPISPEDALAVARGRDRLISIAGLAIGS